MIKRKKNKTTKKVDNKQKIKKQQELIKSFKDKYFSYYDDIKDYTRGKEDW